MSTYRALSLAPLLAAMLTVRAPAQTGPAASAQGSVTGTVVTAATGQPIDGAVVLLEATADGSVVAPSSAFLGRSLVAVTDADGAYRFAALSPGSYRMVVRHLGFRPAILQVDVTQPAPFRVSVAMVVTPIRLEPMDTRATPSAPYARMMAPNDERRFGRLGAEQFRTERFLEGDAAILTHTDVIEAVTLGETDLFRAVQRLPGVSTRDDFTASLWTRGAQWSETRVYFDGLPLFNPVHAIGVFAGVNPDAVGTASFHPGARPTSIGEGAAGVLNVTSRRPQSPGVSALGEVSVISARGAVDWASKGGRTAAMFAARRSYVDLVTRLAESMGADSGTYIPYAFYDLTARVDADLGRGFGFEASGLVEEDHVTDAVPGLLRPTAGLWGNRVARASLLSPLGGWRMRTTAGVSEFSGHLGPRQMQAPPASGGDPLPEHPPMHNEVRALVLSSEVTPHGRGAPPTWSAGVQLSVQQQSYHGQYPRPYPVTVLPDTLRLDERVPIASLWGEKRWGIGRHAALELGLRFDAHRPLRNAEGLGVAPKASFRVTPPRVPVTFSLAAARSFQYTQALAPAGPSIGPDLYVTDVWLLANDTIPAVRSDVFTAGAEAFVGRSWTVSLNAYRRHSTGIAVPEPSPGALRDANNQSVSRPIFTGAANDAHGVELALRRIVGAWTASASYSYGISNMRARSAAFGNAMFTYPSSADRRHVLDLTAMVRLGPAVRVGAAFTATTGAPFTRFILDAVNSCDTLPGGCTDTAANNIEMPNANRSPGYASLDALLDWSRTIGRFRVGAYLQVRNVLNRENAVTYNGSVGECYVGRGLEQSPVSGRPGVCDRFKKGVPILPLAGVRVAF